MKSIKITTFIMLLVMLPSVIMAQLQRSNEFKEHYKLQEVVSSTCQQEFYETTG